jgi:hypothetical protein
MATAKISTMLTRPLAASAPAASSPGTTGTGTPL